MLKRLCYGAFWGIIVFSFHFIWLYELLLTKSHATLLQASFIYCFVIFYASLLSSLWFLHFRWLGFVVSTFIFYFFVHHFSLWFLGRAEGYPFLHPFIPVANYKLFLYVYSLIFCFSLPQKNNLEKKDVKLFYLKPTGCFCDKKANHMSASALGQRIYHDLCHLELEKYSNSYKSLIVIAPETYYPFCLNKYPDQVKLWGCAMPKNAHFLLGSQRMEGQGDNAKIFQSVYWLNKSRIMHFYDKKHCVPFTEKIPSKWKYFSWARNLFLKEKGEFNVSCLERDNDCFYISDDLFVIPKLCSELFFASGRVGKKENKKDTMIFFFVNDSWFLLYFRTIMKQVSILKALEIGVPLLYISHVKHVLII